MEPLAPFLVPRGARDEGPVFLRVGWSGHGRTALRGLAESIQMTAARLGFWTGAPRGVRKEVVGHR